MEDRTIKSVENNWPERPRAFPYLMTSVETAMFLSLDQIGHIPDSAKRILNYWRDHGELKATTRSRLFDRLDVMEIKKDS